MHAWKDNRRPKNPANLLKTDGDFDIQSEPEEFQDLMKTLRIQSKPLKFLDCLAHWMHAWKYLELPCALDARLSAPLASLAALARSLRASCHVERLKPS